MLFNFEELSQQDRYKLLVATIVPRPIAWVTTMDKQGVVNAAPFSFFNAMASDPPTLALGVGSASANNPKDTRRNIVDTGEFVVNLVAFENGDKMNITAVPFPPEVDELQEAGLTAVPSESVAPPRIAESPVSFECKLMQVIPLGDYGMILGTVLRLHVRDAAVSDAKRKHIDVSQLDLLGRMEGGWYTRTRERLEIPRLSLEDWQAK